MHVESVAELVRASGQPFTTIQLPTQPGPWLTDADRDHLVVLLGVAEHQLQGHPDGANTILSLDDAAAQADRVAPRHGMALLAGPGLSLVVTTSHRLPARCTVDEHAVLRDLLVADHWAPRCHLLILDGDLARLSTGGPGRWVAPTAGPFPLARLTDQGAHLRQVVAGLVEVIRGQPLPIVVAAHSRRIVHVARTTTNLHLVDLVPLSEPPVFPGIEQQVERAMRRHLRRENQLAHARLLIAEMGGHVHRGTVDVLAALRRGQRGTLLVAVTDDGGGPEAWTSTRATAADDDALEAALRIVLHDGGTIVCLPSTMMRRFGRLALIPASGDTAPSRPDGGPWASTDLAMARGRS